MDIQQIRQQYPQYSDLSDFQIANALHQKYYSDLPVQKVYQALGVGAGYQDGNGSYVPIQNAGQPAQGPEGSVSKGLVQGAYNVARQAVETPVSGIAQLGALALGKNPDAARNAVMNFGNFTSDKPVQQATSDAVQTAVSKVFNAPLTLYDKSVRNLQAEAQGLPWAPAIKSFENAHPFLQKLEAAQQGVGDVAAQVGPMLAGPKLFSDTAPEASAAEAAPAQSSIPASVMQARNAGYKLPPSEAAAQGAPAPIGKVLEGVTGSAKLRTSTAIHSQAVTDKLAAQDIGVNPGTPLTDAVLDQARAPHNAVYKEAAGLSDKYGNIQADQNYQNALAKIEQENQSAFGGNPDISSLLEKYAKPEFSSADAIAAIKSLRKNATSNYKASNAFQVKNAYELGDLADAQRAVADAIESQLDRFAQSKGQAGLVDRLRQARQQLAKINSVDAAIKEGTTNVSAPALARAYNRGAPLSGNLRTIAEVANNFPRIVTEPGKLGNKVPFNMWETGVGGLGGGAAWLMHDPAILAATGGAMVARPLTRAALLSDAYQGALTKPGFFSPTAGPLYLQSTPSLLLGALEAQRLSRNGQPAGTQ